MAHDHDHGHSHDDLFQGLAAELQPLLDSSEQGIYLYLDDELKICNERFSSLLGYASPEDWAGTSGSFPSLFVDEGSQDKLIGAYQKAMQKMVASVGEIRWKKKSGDTVDTTVMLVPISYQGHLFALHFVS